MSDLVIYDKPDTLEPPPKPRRPTTHSFFSNSSDIQIHGGHFQVGDIMNTATFGVQSGNLDDPSTKIWAIYVAEAEKFDRALVERWKGDMDGILIFAGLFSATITAFIIESYKELKPDPEDITIALLSQISQQLALLSNGQAPAVSVNNPQKNSSTSSALFVNAFWFLSLALSIITALTATLVQQWARHYLQAIERHPSPQIRARIRTYLYIGITQFRVTAVVDGIPTLLHLAVFFFFAGLVQFLLSINLTIARIIISLTVVFAFIYLSMTLGPIFIPNFPFRSPLSTACWQLAKIFPVPAWLDPENIHPVFFKEMYEIPEMLARKDTSLRDQEALSWTLQALIDDRELEPFVDGIPGYLLSDNLAAKASMRAVLCNQQISFINRITGLLKTCNPTESMSQAPRVKRAVTCFQGISALLPLLGYSELDGNIAFPMGNGLLGVLHELKKDDTKEIPPLASFTLTQLISKLQSLVKEVLSLPDPLTVAQAQHIQAALKILREDYNDTALKIVIESLEFKDNAIGSRGIGSRTFHRIDPITHTLALRDFINDCIRDNLMPPKTYMQLVFLLPWFQWDEKVYEAISQLDGELKPYTNCCAARLAINLQSDMVCAIWTPKNIIHGSDKELFLYGRSKLRKLNLLGAVIPEYSKDTSLSLQDIQYELELAIQLEGKFLCRDLMRFTGQLQQQIELPGIAGHRSLSSSVLLLSGTYRHEISLPPIGRLLLIRGRMAVLIHSIQTVTWNIPESALVVILKTLKLVRGNAEAHFASAATQSLLVRVIVRSISEFRDQLSGILSVEPCNAAEAIIDVFIDILGEVGAPDAQETAKKFLLDQGQRTDGWHWHIQTVQRAIKQLESSKSFSPPPNEQRKAIQEGAANRFLRDLVGPTYFQVNNLRFMAASVQDGKPFKKLWAKHAGTGYLKQDDFGFFFCKLTGALESRIYPSMHSFKNICAASKPGPDDEVGPVEGLHLEKLAVALNKIDPSIIEKRRKDYARLYHAAVLNCDVIFFDSRKEQAISKTRMQLIMNFYKLDPESKNVSLKELVVRTSVNDAVEELVALDHVRSLRRGSARRRWFLNLKERPGGIAGFTALLREIRSLA